MIATLPVAPPNATAPPSTERDLIALVRRSVDPVNQLQTVAFLKDGLVEMARRSAFQTFEFPPPQPDRYARRLVYSDPWERFTIIAMTWNTGQGTKLHDHSGVWCVEVVVDGEMEVVNFEMVDQDAQGRYRFEQRETLPALPASSGALIPPFEHHVFSNVGAQPSHTLHVYGGPMSWCNVFDPVADGWYRRNTRELCFDE